MTLQQVGPDLDYAHELISSRRVEGTPVYDRGGKKIGAIHSVMIGKTNGQVAYALMSFGGFLGMREHVHPIPWDMLRYDMDHDGYTVDLAADQLKDAPALHLDEADRPRDREYEERMYNYYDRLPWWGL
ncbi:PRC-barrel domain-containing protein [Allosphingosinicella indica]|uniref:PRC-barrel domain-containing protein n=1 Tax=Allosphingosinicella indica TaxID=941907 RepID=A0A1X7FZJ0_9SPHN|nr:PRC-barrel domain-containing protein [Allosphingosinicella indica]SMF61436.1 PRC-barrel domain-containing protein [Allosphingosinicella indica]